MRENGNGGHFFCAAWFGRCGYFFPPEALHSAMPRWRGSVWRVKPRSWSARDCLNLHDSAELVPRFSLRDFGDLSNPPAARFSARKAGSIRVVLSCVHPCPCWFKAVRMFGIKQALSVKSHEREHFLASKLGREPRFFAASLVPPMRQTAAREWAVLLGFGRSAMSGKMRGVIAVNLQIPQQPRVAGPWLGNPRGKARVRNRDRVASAEHVGRQCSEMGTGK